MNLLFTVVFSLLLNGVLYSQVAFQNGSFEDPDNSQKYRADGGGGFSKLNGNLVGWWADAKATDCGRESIRTEGTVPDGKYVGFAYNNDGGVVWNLAGTVEPGLRDLNLTFYVQESWPQSLVGMSVIIKFATFEGTDTSNFVLVDSLAQDWDITNADANGFVPYEFSEILPESTEGKNLLIGFDIAHENAGGTWVNFDKFELEVNSVSSIHSSALKNTRIYPNPAKNVFSIDTKTNELNQYSLFDITGKMVLEGYIHDNRNVDINSLNNGVYVLKIQNSRGSYAVKFIKE